MYKRCKTFQFILQSFYNLNTKHYKHIKNRNQNENNDRFGCIEIKTMSK